MLTIYALKNFKTFLLCFQMLNKLSYKIRDIFVGRKKELETLEEIWRQSMDKKKENLVYVLLNAPGVGKTTLVHHFGDIIEKNRKGLYIPFDASSDYTSSTSLNKGILEWIQDRIQEKQILIQDFINRYEHEDQKEYYSKRFQAVREEINSSLIKKTISIDDVMLPFKGLSEIIPIVFVIDEIQEFQKVSFTEGKDNQEETALHYFTRILKNFLKSKILIILSGTRYHILSQIGYKIGSPIREKAHPLILANLNVDEISEYVLAVHKLINELEVSREWNAISVNLILDHYKRFLLAFSGGHPRTIERITFEFLMNMTLLIEEKQYHVYERFLDYLLPLTIQAIHGSLLTTDKEEELLKSKKSEIFGKVKEWILRKSHNGFLLGVPPGFGTISAESEEIQGLIYDFMNLGFIVQNGNSNYYLTSYYHLLAFLKPFQEESESFLKEVLYNKHFKLMCGSHSGFGYTFENVFSAALLLQGKISNIEAPKTLNFSRLKEGEILNGSIKWDQILLEEDVLYQSPQALGVDIFCLQKNNLILMQLTTANPPDTAKIEALKSEMEKIEGWMVEGWLISLYPLSKPSKLPNNLLITSGQDLKAILGEDLYSRLRDIKQSL